MSTAPKSRPKYYDLSLAHLPPPGLVSIFHRVSGALLFFPVLPILLYLLQGSLTSEEAYARWHDFFSRPFVKIVVIGAVWLYAHHFFAGIRYLLIDLHLGVARAPSRTSAVAVLVLGVITTIAIGWCVW